MQYLKRGFLKTALFFAFAGIIGSNSFSASFPISSSSYLGGAGDGEGVYGVRIKSNGDIVLAAELSNDAEALKSAAKLAEIGDSKTVGAVLILSPDGKTVKHKSIVSRHLRDISLDASDNIYLAAGEDGLISLSPDSAKLRWKALEGKYVHRVDIGSDGTLAALVPTNTEDPDSKSGPGVISLFNVKGGKIAEFAGHSREDRNTLDVCVDGASKTVVIVGWRQSSDWSEAANKGGPVQIAFMRGLSYQGAEKWMAYDWSTDGTSERYLNKPENNMADTRGLRCCIGDDGRLYAVFMCAGGNHIFRYSPFSITQRVDLVKGDKFNEFSGSKSEHKTYFGRYNPATGERELGQQLTARISPVKTNMMWCDKGDIAADKDGRVYLVGTSAYGLPIWPNKMLDKEAVSNTFNPFGVGSYLGGPFLVVSTPDFTGREYVTRISPYGGNARCVAVREIAGKKSLAWGGTISLGGPCYIKDAMQSIPGYGVSDGFFTVHAAGVSGEAGESPALATIELDISGDVGYKGRIQDADPQKQILRKNESSGKENVVYLYPWSEEKPLSPPKSSGYAGMPFYGGLRIEIENCDPERKSINRKDITSPFKLSFGAKRQKEEKLLLRAAIFAKVADGDGYKTGDKASFDINSALQVHMGCPAFLTYPWKNEKGEVTWKAHFWGNTEFRWLVKDSGRFYLSKICPPWKSHQDLTLQLGFENDADDGEWTEWAPSESLDFDSKTAKFAKMDFHNIEAVGFWLGDSGFRPTPESENAGINKPNSADAVLNLNSFSATLALNSAGAKLPKADFSVSNALPCAGEEIALDASPSEPGEGVINFIAWDLGDGYKTSGRTARHSYKNCGPHNVRLTIWNDKLQSSSTIKRIEIFPPKSAAAEKKKMVAVFGGLAIENFPNIERNSKPLKDQSQDIDGDNTPDLKTEVAYDETVAFTTLPGTRLYAGWMDESKMPPPDPKNPTHINNSLIISDPAKYKKIDSKGRWIIGYRVRQHVPGRVRFIGMVMKDDFLNGWNDAAKSFAFGKGSRLVAGPFQEISPEAGKIRFVVKDAEGYWASEKFFVGPSGKKDELSYDQLPVFVMDFSGGKDDGKWCKFDPFKSLGIDKSAKFAVRKFKDVQGVGILGDSENIGAGGDLGLYEIRLDAHIQ